MPTNVVKVSVRMKINDHFVVKVRFKSKFNVMMDKG